MATGLKGMNIEQAQALSKACTNDSSQIDQITASLTNQLNNTEWLGEDADAFRNAWESEYSKALKQVSAALQGAAEHLNKEADAQIQASGS